LVAFAEGERRRLDTHTGNIAAALVSELANLLGYLDITAVEYAQAVETFMENLRRQDTIEKRLGPGTHPVTDEHLKLLVEGADASRVVHLRIETFYLFAKILLDKLARLFPNYFGQGQGVRLRKHSQLKKALPKFAQEKGLTIPPTLTGRIDELSDRIAVYRDHSIVHAHDPRLHRSTAYDLETGEVSIATGTLPSRGGAGTGSKSETPTTLRTLIHSYVIELVDFLESNRDKATTK
jgi:hypothetical protein